MCFIKKSSAPTIKADPVIVQEPVQRQKADANLTKPITSNSRGIKDNIKTSAYGLEDTPDTQKKTLLGE